MNDVNLRTSPALAVRVCQVSHCYMNEPKRDWLSQG